MSDVPAPVKPGYKTTEAWLAFATALPGVAVASGLLPQSSPIVAVASLVLSTVSSALYIMGRTKVKVAS